MRKLSGFCILVAVGFTTANAVAAGSEPVGVQQALQRLRADIPLVRLYQQGARVTRIYGQPLSYGLTPQDAAEQFVLNYAGVFGVEAGELEPAGLPGAGGLVQPLMFEPGTGEYRFYLVRYAQQRDGIPVFRAELRVLVRNSEDFPVVLAASSLRDLGDFSPTLIAPVIRTDLAEAAVAAAQRTDLEGAAIEPAAPGFTSFTQPALVIWAGVGDTSVEPRLAATFVADNYDNPDAARPEKWLFVADAATGDILYQESKIVFTDIVGNVSGMATTLPKSAACNPEQLTPMPYARAYVQGGNTTYADANGDFVIPHAGSDQVTVFSPMSGLYFYVDNIAGSEENLSQSVTPPGPANFVHNEANTQATVVAQVNGYVQANVVRDFALTYNPAYPVISTQTNWPVNVNRSDGYCPGNAWYDGYSINFCLAGSGYTNTAYSSVIHHEYGHHLVEMGGSGQGEYGEGMADCMAALIADDPVLAYGFSGNCNAGIRTADNDLQYPCSGEIHYCGQLLSGCVWSTRQELAVTHPDEALEIISSLTVNSILLHTGESIAPDITIDFLTLDDTDGDIYNGTPHGVEICAGFGAHNMDCPDISFDPIGFVYPEGRPQTALPHQATSFPVQVVPLSGTPVPGTGQLSYRVDGGEWVTGPMTQTAPNEYLATLPGAACFSNFDWYVSAQAQDGQTVYHPHGAPAVAWRCTVATGTAVTFSDDFETDQGWTVYAGATTGNWERADPQQVTSSGVITQPGDDHTPNGTLCYVTGPLAGSGAGSYDVDGGPTILTSPVFNLEGTDGWVSYWRWFHLSTQWDDEFLVQVSNDNGTNWVTAERLTDRETWTYAEWRVGDYVTPTAQVRVRFVARDNPNNSLYEALVDDFQLVTLVCEEPECPGDLDGDLDIDLADLSQLLANYGAGGVGYEQGDLDGDGDVDLSDLSMLLAVYGTDCR